MENILPGRAKIHFLHVGKTGGTALRLALLPFSGDRLVFHEHEFGLPELPATDLAIFAVREPISRFVSGFYSRLRKGRPRINAEWTLSEREAFTHFSTANALAEGLSSEDRKEAAAAAAAMAAINHVNSPLANWLVSPDYLIEKVPQIAFIAHQPELDQDFERIKQYLDLPQARLPSDPTERHENPKSFDVRLSALAEANLQRWYRDDCVLYRACLAVRDRIIDGFVPTRRGRADRRNETAPGLTNSGEANIADADTSSSSIRKRPTR